NYLMINMVLVMGKDMPTPTVKSMTKLRPAGGHLQCLWIQAETNRMPVGILGKFGSIRSIWKNDFTPPVPKFFLIFPCTNMAHMGKINPVIQTIQGVIYIDVGIG